MAQDLLTAEGTPDRTSLLFAGALLVAGLVVSTVAEFLHVAAVDGAQQLHAAGGQSAEAWFTAYAYATDFTQIHATQFVGTAVLIFGILAVCFALNVNSGIAGIVNRLAAASAIAALALNGVLHGVYGVALKQAVDAWVNAPASEQPALFAAAQSVRGLQWGVWSYSEFVTGLALLLLAIVIASSARIPRPIGYVMALSGLGYIVHGYAYGTAYTATSDFFLPSPGIVGLPLIAWTIWLLVSAFRMEKSSRESRGRSIEVPRPA